ncbi:hypothetical protein TNCT_123711 [Trichonephila clavata]|uniref:Uncharacterized protein n=1 Tax=Trichonephila clavata TaxID=2740835 RepID=A0A8X6FNN4_TRICU|nr:hypothetical protein TNCT_123711 [Trichonephila clavata]
MIKRWHCQLKSAIKCLATEKWVEALPAVLLGIQCSLKEDLNCSAAELVFGNTLRLPGGGLERKVSFQSRSSEVCFFGDRGSCPAPPRTNPVKTQTTTRYGRCVRSQCTKETSSTKENQAA